MNFMKIAQMLYRDHGDHNHRVGDFDHRHRERCHPARHLVNQRLKKRGTDTQDFELKRQRQQIRGVQPSAFNLYFFFFFFATKYLFERENFRLFKTKKISFQAAIITFFPFKSFKTSTNRSRATKKRNNASWT